MPVMELEGIMKTFTVSRRAPGRHGAISGFFHREKQTIRALDGIGFTIEEGDQVGYIGPNGAGKSTSVKVMCGILTPEGGKCRILGRTPWLERAAYTAHIGVVFGQRSQLWWDVPVLDSFDLLRDIYRIPQARYRARLDELCGALDVGGLLQTPVRQLSLGQRMRCEIAASLLHSPRILFLDEPTIGLDAVSKLALRGFLREENRRHGVTMILTTHDMDDIEALCSRVMTIGHGRLLYDGSLSGLRDRYAPLRRIKARLDGARPAPPLPAGCRAEMDGDTCTVLFDPRRITAPALIAELSCALPLRDVATEEQDIDEIIAAMYEEMGL